MALRNLLKRNLLGTLRTLRELVLGRSQRVILSQVSLDTHKRLIEAFFFFYKIYPSLDRLSSSLPKSIRMISAYFEF